MRKRTFALILGLLLLLPGCGKTGEISSAQTEEPPAEEMPVEPEVIEPEVVEPEVPEFTNPLTGLAVEEDRTGNRPVAIMFNNLKQAQPQIGISQADIIYEIPAEGGITRMLGLFQSLDGIGNLGSIRSTRPYYIEVALAHEAMLVHAGGSPEAYQDIKSWDVDNMDGVNGGSDAQIFWRDADRRKNLGYEHSMLTSGENIADYAAAHFNTEHSSDYTYTQAFRADAAPDGGTSARKVTVEFSTYKTGVFDYDASSGRYLASQYGTAHVDGYTGDRVSAVNLLILKTEISLISGDDKGRLTVRTTGSGDGIFCCGGQAADIKWSRQDRNSPFVYTNADGTPLELQQGNSYVCIISPKSSKVTLQ